MSARAAPGRQPDTALVRLVELLFFAYRDFTAEPDAILGELGFGRAHHRVLHFVARHPGLRVADLLGILRITKQSLARVLKQLVDEGYVLQAAGPSDRRERRLHLTEQGDQLAARLLDLQMRRLAAALPAAGPDAQAAVEAFLLAVVGPDREDVARLTGSRAATTVRRGRAAARDVASPAAGTEGGGRK